MLSRHLTHIIIFCTKYYICDIISKGMFADQISDMIEEEVQRRLSLYVKVFAEHFFTSECDLYKVIGQGSSKTSLQYCKGKSKSGKRCKNKGKHNGYCHLHQQRKTRDEPSVTSKKPNECKIGSPSRVTDDIF